MRGAPRDYVRDLYNYLHVSSCARGIVVEKLLEYLMYKKLHKDTANPKDIPDFQERIIPEIGLELSVINLLTVFCNADEPADCWLPTSSIRSAHLRFGLCCIRMFVTSRPAVIHLLPSLPMPTSKFKPSGFRPAYIREYSPFWFWSLQ